MGWPECEPRSIGHFTFIVGPDDWGNPSPDEDWPAGNHLASCRLESIAPSGGETLIDLSNCTDGAGDDVVRSLDLLYSNEAIAVPNGLVVGGMVDVSYSILIEQAYVYRSWYSLRDGNTGELLLAAFSDPGPDIAPKVPGFPVLDDWLAPVSAVLGAAACEPEPGCERDDSPQRALVEFATPDGVFEIVGGTLGSAGQYTVHLGFAGVPDVCDFLATHNTIEGLLFR